MSAKQGEPRVPGEHDLERPNVARMYDWYLGGTTNVAADQEFGKHVLDIFPIVRPVALVNRQLLHRIVRHLVRQGIRQFVDIGSGVPTMGNVHQVADDMAPSTRVVYVDHDPVAVAHSRTLLASNGDPDRHVAVQADLRAAETLWKLVLDTGIVDAKQPIGLLMFAVVAFVSDEEAQYALEQYRRFLPPGSCLAISHLTDDGAESRRAVEVRQAVGVYERGSNPVRLRTREEIRRMFGDFDLIEPGMCWAPEWHPEEAAPDGADQPFIAPDESCIWVGVAHKS